MPKFTRKRGGAHSLPAHKSRTRSRKVLVGRPTPGSRAATILASRGIGASEYFPPSRKTRTRAVLPTRMMSARVETLAKKKATRETAKANAAAKAKQAANARKAKKEAEAAEAAEEAEMERLREEELRTKVKTYPVIAPSSWTHPIEHAKHVKNFQNTLQELGNTRRSRAPKVRAQKNRGAPNLGKLALSPIKENNVKY